MSEQLLSYEMPELLTFQILKQKEQQKQPWHMAVQPHQHICMLYTYIAACQIEQLQYIGLQNEWIRTAT